MNPISLQPKPCGNMWVWAAPKMGLILHDAMLMRKMLVAYFGSVVEVRPREVDAGSWAARRSNALHDCRVSDERQFLSGVMQSESPIRFTNPNCTAN